MKINENTIVYPLPTDSEIREVERSLRINLPNEYISFIKRYNGAEAITNQFQASQHEYLLERFLCILENSEDDEQNGWYDIEVVISQIGDRLTDNEDLVGMNIVPIAALFAGDYVCLDCRNEAEPSVVIWDHEESDEFSPVLIKISNNISEFFGMLKE